MFDPATGAERARLADGSGTLLPLPGESPSLLVAGYDTLRAIDAERREVWSAPAAFSAYEVAVSGDVAVATDSEGRVAVYRLPG